MLADEPCGSVKVGESVGEGELEVEVGLEVEEGNYLLRRPQAAR